VLCLHLDMTHRVQVRSLAMYQQPSASLAQATRAAAAITAFYLDAPPPHGAGGGGRRKRPRVLLTALVHLLYDALEVRMAHVAATATFGIRVDPTTAAEDTLLLPWAAASTERTQAQLQVLHMVGGGGGGGQGVSEGAVWQWGGHVESTAALAAALRDGCHQRAPLLLEALKGAAPRTKVKALSASCGPNSPLGREWVVRHSG
jgi:hypothetical protein